MIESPAIKKFIMDHFIENGQEDIIQMSLRIQDHLLQNFVVNEVVLSRSSELAGRVIRVLKSRYVLLVYSDDGNYEGSFGYSELLRKETVTADMIKGYLMDITTETPFGRVLKENVFRTIKSPSSVLEFKTFASQQCRQPMSCKKNTTAKMKGTEEETEDAEPLNKRETDKLSRNVEGKRYRSVSGILGLNQSKRMTVRGFDQRGFESLMKLFSFLSNFNTFFDIGRITLEELAEAIIDPAYDSKLAFKIHSKLAEALLCEIDNTGIERFAENIKSALMLVEELAQSKKKDKKSVEGTCRSRGLSSIKTNMQFTEKNWKASMKSFVDRLCGSVGDNVAIFADCISEKKHVLDDEQLEVRLAFIEFLLNSFFITNIFRDIIHEEMDSLKELEDRKKEIQSRFREVKSLIRNSTDVEKCACLVKQRIEIEKELKSITGKILESPLKVEMGSVDGVCFLNIDKRIYAIRDGDYYCLPKDMLGYLYKHYIPRYKAEKSVLLNLLQHTEILQS